MVLCHEILCDYLKISARQKAISRSDSGRWRDFSARAFFSFISCAGQRRIFLKSARRAAPAATKTGGKKAETRRRKTARKNLLYRGKKEKTGKRRYMTLNNDFKKTEKQLNEYLKSLIQGGSKNGEGD